MDNYYEVFFMAPMVQCDDWTRPVDEIWYSYVVIPQNDKAYNQYVAEVKAFEEHMDKEW